MISQNLESIICASNLINLYIQWITNLSHIKNREMCKIFLHFSEMTVKIFYSARFLSKNDPSVASTS